MKVGDLNPKSPFAQWIMEDIWTTHGLNDKRPWTLCNVVLARVNHGAYRKNIVKFPNLLVLVACEVAL